MNESPYDFIAIGVGPCNLGLACLTAPLPGVRSLFLERKPAFSWHPGMLLDGTTLQNPFLADLVSMADPTSPFSYLSYCKQQGRLYTYYIRENWYLDRQEFDRYCRWAASRLDNLRCGRDVHTISHDAANGLYQISGQTEDGTPFTYQARKLVIGIGGVPRLPDCCAAADHAHLVHSSGYLAERARLQAGRSITVIGSGQSGAEVYHDLLQDSERHGYRLNWVTRAPRFFQMEDAKLTLELITPEYGDYFYGLDPAIKAEVLEDQRSIYNGINQSLIERIYALLDERRHRDSPPTRLLTSMALDACRRAPDGRGWELDFRHTQLNRRYRHRTDAVVFATGYRHQVPAFVEGIRARIRWNGEGGYSPSKRWAVDHHNREIYVQNVGLQSHGLTNPDLGLACFRNSRLLAELTGHDHYPSEPRTAFQDFVPGEDSGFVALEREAVGS
ncbi:lysine N(6)-hydroxylase/L-ornithine N(5)-oxygenase family protein [Stutzerimonas azotifigens]|uniref:SidA/IucD/PvdA family monooxygenase n=1 Tax=Stutzerimonas azotifigens TaxID=291995 RepID=A0ABR5YUZ2_9GAMM|nr:SidA/IucD/PvdA family monooxygenase [Stutzerimonas azotifigens]MBA1271755.1 SidA/IucD/PvdA family monooxygenase [Stutzerimonas azotifigens]